MNIKSKLRLILQIIFYKPKHKNFTKNQKKILKAGIEDNKNRIDKILKDNNTLRHEKLKSQYEIKKKN